MIEKKRIAIIGVGPRAICLLERFNHFLLKNDDLKNKIEFHLINKSSDLGVGEHRIEQSDELLINVICCQITMFPDSAIKDTEKFETGPNLYEWCLQQKYRKFGSKIIKVDSEEGEIFCENIEPNDYLPRYLVGKYFKWRMDLLITKMREQKMSIHIHISEAIDVNCENEKYVIELKNETKVEAEFLIISTGHVKSKPTEKDINIREKVRKNVKKNCKYLINPLSEAYELETINSKDLVAIRGMGLTSLDIITLLTLGKGGNYMVNEHNHSLEYATSGREPTIYVFSRRGILIRSKPVNQKGPIGQYEPRYFSFKKIDEMKKQGKLDFESQVFSLLKKEMKEEYADKLKVIDPDAIATIETINDIFFPEKILNTSSYLTYFHSFMEELSNDIYQSKLGNQTSPLKSATEVIGDLRHFMRYAVDNKSLTVESYERFIHKWIPAMNLVKEGSPVIRNQQFEALVKQGIVRLDVAFDPKVHFDENSQLFVLESTYGKDILTARCNILIDAKIPSLNPKDYDSMLFENALSKGYVRSFKYGDCETGGCDITSDYEAIGFDENIQKNLFLFGTVAEGMKYFTFALPSPVIDLEFFHQASKLAQTILKRIY